jgi:hypothetical protein
MARPKALRCLIDGCEDIAFYKDSQLCKRCYSRLYQQLQRGVSWMVKRARRLDSWQGGLQYLLGTEKVIRIKPERAKRRKAA